MRPEEIQKYNNYRSSIAGCSAEVIWEQFFRRRRFACCLKDERNARQGERKLLQARWGSEGRSVGERLKNFPRGPTISLVLKVFFG